MHLFLTTSKYFFVFLFALSSALAESKPGVVKGRETKGLSIELVSQVDSIKEGEAFLVGLKIKHDPKFHTYWKNPGIVGVATSIEWKLPEGYKVSGIRWPYPEKSMMAEFPCYGYERDVLLTVKITPPAKLSTKEVKLIAHTNWMCCASNCYPDFKTFSLILPIGEGEKNQLLVQDFIESEKTIPKRTDEITATLLSAADAKIIKVRISTELNVKPLLIFNSDGQTTPDLPHKLIEEKKGSWLFEAERSEFGPKSVKQFPFILQTDEGYFAITASK